VSESGSPLSHSFLGTWKSQTFLNFFSIPERSRGRGLKLAAMLDKQAEHLQQKHDMLIINRRKESSRVVKDYKVTHCYRPFLPEAIKEEIMIAAFQMRKYLERLHRV
jgi:hypothetical protein